MSQSNGVIRVGRKGRKKFAIGEEDDPRKLPDFEVDIVVAFQKWIGVDDAFRPADEDEQGNRPIPIAEMPAYHAEAVAFVEGLGGEAYSGQITTGEALDFIARLREQYDELAVFFRPKSFHERDSPATSEAQSELRFSEEPAS